MDLTTRMERLERQVALWRGITLVLIIGGLVMSLSRVGQAGGGKPKSAGTVLKAPFRVVDERGRTLLFVDSHVVTDDGAKVTVPRLRLFGVHGKAAVELEAMWGGGSLQINDRRGEATAGLAMGSDGSGLFVNDDLRSCQLTLTGYGLNIDNKGGKGGVSLWVEPKGGSFVINDQDFKKAVSLSVDGKGGHLRLRDRIQGTEHTLP